MLCRMAAAGDVDAVRDLIAAGAGQEYSHGNAGALVGDEMNAGELERFGGGKILKMKTSKTTYLSA